MRKDRQYVVDSYRSDEKEISDRHVRIGEQNIYGDKFDGIKIKGKLQYPVIIVDFKGGTSIKDLGYAVTVGLNTIKYDKEGEYFLAINTESNCVCLGNNYKINKDLETIFTLKSLFSRFNFELIEMKDEDTMVCVEEDDLLGTIKL